MSQSKPKPMAVLATELQDGEGRGKSFWKKVVDVEEVKKQIIFAMPMVLTSLMFYFIPVVSIMFAGHLGDIELAASTLANSWARTGYTFMMGLSVALETLCGQAYGAKRYKMLGIYLQTSCIISFMFSILISIIWWYTKPILIILLRQNREVSNEAAVYMRYLIPGIYAYGTLQNIMRFLQTQSMLWPLVLCSTVPLFLQIGFIYVLLRFTTLGFRGPALATSIAYWISVIMLMIYVRFVRTLKETWTGFTNESFRFILTNFKLALTSATMVSLEYWAFEVVTMLAGLMPNSELSTSIVSMCLATEGIAYNVMAGLSAAISTRVSNELGAKRPDRAKHAVVVAMKMSIVLVALILIAIGFGHEKWAYLFSKNDEIIKSFSELVPWLCVTIFFDSIQIILSGVNRGIGWQSLTTFINLSAYFGIGVPIGCLFAFKLHLYAKGLWIGITLGIVSQTCALSLVSCFKKWTTFEQPRLTPSEPSARAPGL